MVQKDHTVSPHERKIKKFLRRADIALSNSLFSSGRDRFEMSLMFSLDKKTGATSAELKMPEFHSNEIKAAIVDCRPFFLVKEDAYLPGVVNALSQVATREHAIALRDNGLKRFVGGFISNDQLVGGGFMYSGRLEMDNGAGAPGQLLSSGQITMDYIYGVALHEDDDKIARLENVSSDETIMQSVAMELAHLMHAVAVVREQIRLSAANGHLSIDVEVGAPTEWSEPGKWYKSPSAEESTS
ncbi:hypothetical protein FB468_0731 [Leucobacter komagatae]|uniref:Uncharacterized protein n=1 Tax=Leucobacter komagatae TaxID=55969 RepID=A0A542Y3S3_9MICO|nr:hypothetical protein FB468_0731 [Leucobacter komagatae]